MITKLGFLLKNISTGNFKKDLTRKSIIAAVSDSENKGLYRFYKDPTQVIIPEDYIQLDSLHEYFYELIPSVQLSWKNNKYTMRVFKFG
jgi:hypothetical protein